MMTRLKLPGLFGLFIVALMTVTGCKSDIWADQSPEVISQYKVADSAKTVAESDGVLQYTAPQKGIIYLLDRDDQTVLKSKNGGTKKRVARVIDKALLLKAQTYQFDPAAGTAGTRGVDRTPIHVQTTPGHHYQLRFDTEETSS